MTTFVTDDLDVDLRPVDDDGNVVTDTPDGFDWQEQARVVIDNQPWADSFGTDEFYRLEATVARPIEQTYHIDDQEIVAKKLPEELRQAQWGLDNAPYVLGHPDQGVVTDADDIHGFWRQPRYLQHDDEPDEQKLRLYVPVTDEDAQQYLDESQSISVGFFADFDTDTDEDGVDAYQRNLRYDHVASVRVGRCSAEDGCKVSLGDAVQTTTSSAEPTSGSNEPVAQFDTTADSEDVSHAHGGCTTGDCSCGLHEHDTSTDMTDDDNPTLDVSALSVDAITDRHDGVAELAEQKSALADKKAELEEQKEALSDRVDELEAELDEYRQSEREELVEQITDLTDHWDEESMLDEEDGPSMAILEDRAEFAREELADDDTETTTVGDGENHEPEDLGGSTSDGAAFMPDSAKAGGLTDD